MGGEPTFVSVDDLESAEWNIAAVGPTKRGLADDLIRKLRTRFAPGGLLHYGQGKWYPGESLPRWAFGLYWRKDGVPIWKNPDLIATIEKRARPASPTPNASRKALRNGSASIPNTSAGVRGPLALAAEGSGTAAQCRPLRFQTVRSGRALAHGAGVRPGAEPAQGFVLPIQRWNAEASRSSSRWKSERWNLRRGNLFLTPGDSPLGLRLPIASLPHIEPDEYPYIVEQDPLEPREELPVYDGAAPAEAAPHQDVSRAAAQARAAACAPRCRSNSATVSCAPSCRRWRSSKIISNWSTAVEATAEEMQMQVHVEGYPPPFDPRVK